MERTFWGKISAKFQKKKSQFTSGQLGENRINTLLS